MQDIADAQVAESLDPQVLIRSLIHSIDQVIAGLIPEGAPCALVDFPSHSNVGDSAIWLGEKKVLRRRGVTVVYVCDGRTYARKHLTKRLGREGIILIHGGGNLGDLWPAREQFREKIIQDFTDHKIIQLPQSIHFAKSENLKQAKVVFNAHPDLTILVRDTHSFEMAKNEFSAKSILCPDLAFALDRPSRPSLPESEMVWLSRTDKESMGFALDDTSKNSKGAPLNKTDWLGERPTLTHKLYTFVKGRIERRPTYLGWCSGFLSQGYDWIANQRLERGYRALSRGRVVITDRLHGHILSLLLGIPHVLLDNNYGKLRRFYETWTSQSSLTFWATSPEQARTLAEKLLRQS